MCTQADDAFRARHTTPYPEEPSSPFAFPSSSSHMIHPTSGSTSHPSHRLHQGAISPADASVGNATKLAAAVIQSPLPAPLPAHPRNADIVPRATNGCSRNAYIVRDPYAVYHVRSLGTIDANPAPTNAAAT